MPFLGRTLGRGPTNTVGWPEAKIYTPPPWKKECHYTDKSRDVMEITPPSDLEIALGLRPRAISRASGCKIKASANLSVLGGRNFHYIPPIVSVILHSCYFDVGVFRRVYCILSRVIVASQLLLFNLKLVLNVQKNIF